MLVRSPLLPPDREAPQEPRRPRPWGEKFRDALRGIKWGIRGHSSFAVHFFFAALATVAGIVLGCQLVEWCLLVFAIGLVLTAELFNSAVETLFHGLDPDTKERSWRALDIAAGAVLMASFTAIVIGAAVFTHRLLALWGW